MVILSIDPGSSKSGFAVILSDQKILSSGIRPTEVLVLEIKSIILQFKIDKVVIGKGTGRNKFIEIAKEINALVVDEKNSSMDARSLYWKQNPPKGLWRLIPVSLRIPPVPYDDLAAVVLGLRYIDGIK